MGTRGFVNDVNSVVSLSSILNVFFVTAHSLSLVLLQILVAIGTFSYFLQRRESYINLLLKSYKYRKSLFHSKKRNLSKMYFVGRMLAEIVKFVA